MMYQFLQHKFIRSMGVVIVVAAGFFMWLLAHDAIAKPTREHVIDAQARGGVESGVEGVGRRSVARGRATAVPYRVATSH